MCFLSNVLRVRVSRPNLAKLISKQQTIAVFVMLCQESTNVNCNFTDTSIKLIIQDK